MYRERASSIPGAVVWTRTSDGVPGSGPSRRVHGPDVDRRPPRRRRPRHRQLHVAAAAPVQRARRAAPSRRARPGGARRPGPRAARRAGAARRALAAAEVASWRSSSRRARGAGPGARGARRHARPRARRPPIRSSPTSSAGPGRANAWRRSPPPSGCPPASCSAGRSTRSATARSCWPASCASATPWSWPGAGVPLAAVAAQCGYADQAHLADDVRALTGTTLGGLGLGARRSGPAAGEGRGEQVDALPSGSSTVA